METKDRIAKAIEYTGLKKGEFAKKLNITSGYVSNLLQGKYKPSPQLIKNISMIFGINEEWLKTGKGNIEQNLTDEERIANFMGRTLEDIDSDTHRLITILSKLSAKELKAILEICELFHQKKEDE